MANDLTTDASATATLAATNAIPTLPTAETLTAGPATTELSDDLMLYNMGGAVVARFSGAATGEVLIAVEQQVVDALNGSPLGSLDLGAALTPALQAAASALGTVVLAPATTMETVTAVSALMSKPNAAVVPLYASGIVRAIVGIEISQVAQVPQAPQSPVASAPEATGASEVSMPEYPSADQLRENHLRSAQNGKAHGLELLRDVAMEVTAQIGSTRMTISELLSLADGAVIELDRAAGAPADLLVNGHLIARGEVVVIDENFGLRITELVTDTDAAKV